MDSLESVNLNSDRSKLPWLRLSRIQLVAAALVVIVASMFALDQNQAVTEQKLRSDVLSTVSLLRAKLEGNINANIQLVRGLVANVETNPDISQAEFDELAANLLKQHVQIRHIAIAPDLVVRWVYPLTGNERAVGLDYTANPAQRAAVMSARNSGELVLAGPVDLVQGGEGFIGRFPVYARNAMGVREFWGIVSAIVDVQQLYRDSGLLDRDLPIDIAIFGRDAAGAAGAPFYGDPTIVQNDPVLVDVVLPSGSWQIAAVPRNGWSESIGEPSSLYVWLAAAAGLILIPTYFVGRFMDERQRNIAEMKRRKLAIERMSRRLRLALETSELGTWEMDIQNGELFWDARMNELYGFPHDDKVRNYTFWAKRLHPDDKARAEAEFAAAIRETGRYHSEYRLIMENGAVRHIRAIGAVYQDGEFPARIVGVNWDVTRDVERKDALEMAWLLAEARTSELESARERIEFNALHDSLTGLPNRRYLDEVMADHQTAFEAGREVAAILQIDLDRFKHINDTLGHAAGDGMLLHASNVLRDAAAPSDFVARIGGDEFVIVRKARNAAELPMESLADLSSIIMIKLQQPIMIDGHECRVGASIGIAVDTDEVADPSRLLVNADIALYRAKRNGRNCYQFFTDALHTEILTTKRIADDIVLGLERNEFVAHFQPQFDARTHAIVGVEALARWQHPEMGLLGPGYFLKIAEELNVVSEIDRSIFEQSISQLALWDRAGLVIPKASVNVSARRLYDEDLIAKLSSMPLEQGRISFELVESIFLDESSDLLSANVDGLKALGIDIEIDDFGTGHASIVSLLKLQPSRLKIDRQLVLPIVHSPGQRQLVGSIIEMGHSLGIEVMAEGVETREHAEILRALGCDALQGFAFARPMSGAEVLIFANQPQHLRRAS